MNDKKRMLFILEEDYYYVTIKVLIILKAFDCYSKPMNDYRKIGIIFQFLKFNDNYSLLRKLIAKEELTIFDEEAITKLFCDSKLDDPMIKRVLFFLETNNMIRLEKNQKNAKINVYLNRQTDINALLGEEIFEEDIYKCIYLNTNIKRIKSINLDTMQTKIFGFSEVEKWGN